MLTSQDVKKAIKSTRGKKPLRSRLATYGVAATAAAVTGMAADNATADLVTVPVNITSQGSLEVFVNIQGFAAGASNFGVSFASSAFSQANPLAPYSEFMIRGAGPFSQFGPRNTAMHAVYTNFSTFFYMVNVGSPFTLPTFANGTFLGGPSNYNTNSPAALLAYKSTLGGNTLYGQFGQGGVAYFKFVNSQDGKVYNGWASISIPSAGVTTITALHVDTGSAVPEPASAMALLCMGAAGLATYRRKRRAN